MLLSALITVVLAPLITAFSFNVDNDQPAQCGTLNFRWQGGSPPFSLIILPAFDYPTNISIPSSAWTGGSGSYAWTVDYPSGTRFIALMSDTKGTGTGGVSPLYSVAGSNNASSCDLRSTSTDFFFYLNETSVNQCGAVDVYWDDTATGPVTILGAIPRGQPFQFAAADKATSLVWNTNIAANTEFILAAFDTGQYGIGGSSALMTVGGGSSSSCLDDLSPSSTPASNPTATSTKTGGGVKTVTSITTALPAGAAGLSTGAIVGIAVAAVLLVLSLQGALLWFCCRRQLRSLLSHRKQMRGHQGKAGDVDLAEADAQDQPTSLRPVGTSETSDRRSLALPSAAAREDMESSISPYYGRQSATRNGPFDTPPDEDPLPPFQGHFRGDSLSSATSSQPLDFDHSPTNGSLTAFLPNPSSELPRPSSRPSQTKAQIASALSSSNPDLRQEGRDPFGARLPPREAPSGGFRRHEDAGRVGGEAQHPEVEDLPPLYRPEWESDSQRDRGNGGGRRDL